MRLSEETANAINAAKNSGRRVIAVGTTTVRVLETVAAQNNGKLVKNAGKTGIFIHPPFPFQIVDALLTNFHLPRSTLLMLVSAFAAPGETTRTGNDSGGLRGSNPRTLPFFQLWRCDADFMNQNPKQEVQNCRLCSSTWR